MSALDVLRDALYDATDEIESLITVRESTITNEDLRETRNEGLRTGRLMGLNEALSILDYCGLGHSDAADALRVAKREL